MTRQSPIACLVSAWVATLPGAAARSQSCLESCCGSADGGCAVTEWIEVDPAINRREPVAGPGDAVHDLHDGLERVRAWYRDPAARR